MATKRYDIESDYQAPRLNVDSMTAGVLGGLSLLASMQEGRRAEAIALSDQADKNRLASRQLDLDSQAMQLEVAKSKREENDASVHNFLEMSKMRREQADADFRTLETVRAMQKADVADQAKLKYSGLLQEAQIGGNAFSSTWALEDLKQTGAFSLFDQATQANLQAKADFNSGIVGHVGEETYTMARAVADLKSNDPISRVKAGAIAIASGVPVSRLEAVLTPGEVAQANVLAGVSAYNNADKATQITEWAGIKAELRMFDNSISEQGGTLDISNPARQALAARLDLAESKIGARALRAYEAVRDGRLPYDPSSVLEATKQAMTVNNVADPRVATYRMAYAGEKKKILDSKLGDKEKTAALQELAKRTINEDRANAGLAAVSEYIAASQRTPNYSSSPEGVQQAQVVAQRLAEDTAPYFEQVLGKRAPKFEDFFTREEAVKVAGVAEAGRQNRNAAYEAMARGAGFDYRDMKVGNGVLGKNGEIVSHYEGAVSRLNTLQAAPNPSEADKAERDHLYAQLKDTVQLVGNRFVPLDELAGRITEFKDESARLGLLEAIGRQTLDYNRYGVVSPEQLGGGTPSKKKSELASDYIWGFSAKAPKVAVDRLLIAAASGDSASVGRAAYSAFGENATGTPGLPRQKPGWLGLVSVPQNELNSSLVPGVNQAWQLGAVGSAVYDFRRAVDPGNLPEDRAGFLANAYYRYQRDRAEINSRGGINMYRLSDTLGSLPSVRTRLLGMLVPSVDGGQTRYALAESIADGIPQEDRANVAAWLYGILVPSDIGAYRAPLQSAAPPPAPTPASGAPAASRVPPPSS